MITSVGVYGLGMMGGSLVQLIQKHHQSVTIYGYDPHVDTVEWAKKNLDIMAFDQLCQWPKDMDLVFICTPIHAIKASFLDVDAWVGEDALITDIASVKAPFVDLIGRQGRPLILGHPMAGSASSGVQFAQAALLQHATYFLCGAGKDYDRVSRFLQALTFNVTTIDANVHDASMAITSHLPYLLAVTGSLCASNAFSAHDIQDAIGSGFRDATRLSMLSIQWGIDVCQWNKENLLKELSHAVTV